MKNRKPFQHDKSRMTGEAFWEDMNKQKTCRHPRVDMHSDSACPDCNRIFWATCATMSDGLKQQYAAAYVDADWNDDGL